MSFFNITRTKSCRKQHRCYWCGEMVEIGQPKTSTATVFEGDFQSTHFHPECYEALELWQKENRVEEYWPEEGEMKRGLNEYKPT